MFALTPEPAYFSGEVFSFRWLSACTVAGLIATIRIDYVQPPLFYSRGGAFAYAALFVTCVLFLVAGTHNPFIYFRF
jgi:hypothetical protein